jgi:hypothetical protein
MLPGVKRRLLFGACFGASLMIVLAPILPEYRNLAARFAAYLLKTGVHASGGHGILPADALKSLRMLVVYNAPVFYCALIGLAVWLVTLLLLPWRSDLRRSATFTALGGLLVAVALQTFAVLRTPLSYYMVPAMALTGALLTTALWQIVEWDRQRRWFARTCVGVLALVCVGFAAQHFGAGMARTYAVFADGQRIAVARAACVARDSEQACPCRRHRVRAVHLPPGLAPMRRIAGCQLDGTSLGRAFQNEKRCTTANRTDTEGASMTVHIAAYVEMVLLQRKMAILADMVRIASHGVTKLVRHNQFGRVHRVVRDPAARTEDST